MKHFYLLAVLFCAVLLSGAELFVGPGQKYTTVKSGIEALKEGDTLTIAPGKYYETIEIRKKLKNVRIRAQYPGSVLIHGDKPAPRFTRVPGYRFVYVADWKDNVTAVNERENFLVYFPASDERFLEFNFGYWYKKGDKLYISTSDGQAPEKHSLTVSVLNGNGMRLEYPENVVVEGLSFTGFYSHYRVDAWSGRNGIQLMRAKKSMILNCAAFFNSNGISLSNGEDSVIDGCISFANGSQSPSSGGNIIGWSGTRNEIRNCLSMYKLYTGGSQGPIGIRFYGIMDKCKILNCRSFGEHGINIKGTHGGSFAENNYCERHINVVNSRNNIFTHTNGYNTKDVSPTWKYPKDKLHLYYADPENHDFRPLKSVTVGKPEKIVSGSSILLPPKDYPAFNFTADNVSVSTRGAGKRAAVQGGKISGKNIKLENLEITAPLYISGSQITLRNCVVKAKVTIAAKLVQVAHCAFSVQPDFSKSTGFRHSNVGIDGKVKGLHDLEGKFGFDGFENGPQRIVRTPRNITVMGPFIHAVSDTTADIEWWTSSTAVTSELRYGTTPKCEKRVGQPFSGGNWHSVSLTGLKPGTKYYFKIAGRTPLRTHHSNETLAELDLKMKRRVISSDPGSFTTAAKKAAPRVLKVTDGRIAPVLDQARAGDTVMIKGGDYNETLYVRSAGVTIRNMPGERVCINGKRTLESGIILSNKPGTVIDGLYFREFTGGDGAGVVINGGSNITLRRCFYDGRSSSYTPVFVYANSCNKLTVEHCVILRGFHGATFYKCPDLVVRNNVWSNNQINHFYIHNLPSEKALFAKNILLDNIPGKIFNSLIGFWHFESFTEDSNCYYLRQPKNKRLLFKATRKNGAVAPQAMSYTDYLKEGGKNGNSFFANPGFKAVPKLLTFKTGDIRKEMTEFGKIFSKLECGAVKNGFTPWTFDDFKVSDPECVKRKVGPDHSLFKNGCAN